MSEGIDGNGDVRGPVQGAVPRKRHDGVCLTTVRRAKGVAKREELAVKRPAQPRFRLLTEARPVPLDCSVCNRADILRTETVRLTHFKEAVLS